jgi:hypothetical protein
MAFLEHAISLDDLPESTGDGEFKPLPAGRYQVTINKAELRNTKDGTGQYIAVRYDVTGPTHQGRVVFGNINIKNKSEKAESIGRAQLGELMRALGLAKLTDTDQLIGGSLSIKLDVRESRTDEATGKTYEASNDVKGFKASGDAMPSGSAIPSFSKPAAAAPKAEGATPPWAKK